jgi:hypothetical protein
MSWLKREGIARTLLKIYGVKADELRELTHKKLYKDKN